MERNKKTRHSRQIKNRAWVRAKIQTPKILDRITFDPAKHKQKKTRELRQQLQQQKIPGPDPSPTIACLKFGLMKIRFYFNYSSKHIYRKCLCQKINFGPEKICMDEKKFLVKQILWVDCFFW